MNCCDGEVDKNEIIKGYLGPQLQNAGIPQNYSNAISSGLATGNYQQELGKLAQTQFISPFSQQLSGGNPFAQALISNQLGSATGLPQQQGGFGEAVTGIAKKASSGFVKSRLG